MRFEFQNLKISSICSLISSGGTPSRARDEYYTNGYIPWLKTKELFDTNIYDTEEYITDLGLRSSSAKLYPSNTVVLAMYGATVGKLGIMKSEMSTNQACCCMVVDDKKADYRFLFYSLLQNRSSLINLANGAAQQNLNSQIIKDFEIYVPSLPTQKKIAHILSTLDDKIELNRKMNQTLEAMAQALFKSWFVDFDPVHARLTYKSDEELEVAARELGISKEVLELFPSEFEESELGMIPKGWEIKKLGECELEIESGTRPKGGIDKELSSGIPSVGAESIAPIGVFDFSNVKYVTNEFAAKAKRGWVQHMDVALYKDGGKPGIFMPRVSLYGNGYPFARFMINEHVFLLRSELLGQYYLFQLILSKGILDQLIARGSAKAAQPGLNQVEVNDSKFVLPSKELLSAFNKIIELFVVKQLENGKQIQTLQQTRDTLLPKLLSGELDVSEIAL
jgi:type I restriction enzyme S subunit